jgi:hypothetical protein
MPRYTTQLACWELIASLNYLGHNLAAAGALTAERVRGYNDGWGAGWDSSEAYTRNTKHEQR